MSYFHDRLHLKYHIPKHVPMGTTETTVNGLLIAQNRDGLVLIERGKEVGKIIVHKAILSRLPSPVVPNHTSTYEPSRPLPVPSDPASSSLAPVSSFSALAPSSLAPAPSSSAPAPADLFIDYVNGGCEISLMVAIDFTGSNGDLGAPGSLHYHTDGIRNDYEKAILAVGNILSKFDSDQKFPVW
jgi:hypothetical protein